jgi:uncharacterized RDD family membrane protein YckC
MGQMVPVGLSSADKLFAIHEWKGTPVPESDEFLSIDTPENVIFDYEVVGIGTRFIAAMIDSLLVFVALVVINLAGFFLLRNVFDLARGWVAGLFVAISFALIWGYYLFFELAWNGQSPGKRWAGVRVIRRDGTPITLSESIIRNLLRPIDFLPVGYGHVGGARPGCALVDWSQRATDIAGLYLAGGRRTGAAMAARTVECCRCATGPRIHATPPRADQSSCARYVDHPPAAGEDGYGG